MQTKRDKQFVSMVNFEKLLTKIEGHTKHICLHVLGEPLLHPNFVEIVNLCKSHNLNINLVTNGTLIEKLNPNLEIRKISFSLHSFPQENYKDEQQLISALKIYLEKIYNFAKQFVGFVEYRLWNGENDINLNDKILKILSGFYAKKITLETTKIYHNTYLGVDNAFVWPSKNKQVCEGSYCHSLSDHLAILVDGTVVPCCLDGDGKINLGNIYNTDLENIINTERYKTILNGFRRRKPTEDLCKHCNFIERFNSN